MEDYDFKFEEFKNIYDFQRAINSRPNNKVFEGRHASQDKDSWTGTSTYEEADNLLNKGWNCNVEEMKNELEKFSMKIERTQVKHKPNVAGHAPIVPAAIKGVPKSMWTTSPKKKIEQKNYLHIYFSNDTNGSIGAETLMKSGMTVLKLCVILEKMGIKTKIDIMPYFGSRGNSIYSCKIAIKDYRQPFNMLKMAYPIAHASIFRRHGFKYVETMPGCTNKDYAYGYGGTPSGEPLKVFIERYHLEDVGSIFITFKDVTDNDFDPMKLGRAKGLDL